MKQSYKLFLGAVVLTAFLLSTASAQSVVRVAREHDKKTGWIGVMIQDVDQHIAKKEKLPEEAGAYITEVVEGSPADSAGIVEDDVIVEFGGRVVDDSEDLTKAVSRANIGETVTVMLYRNGEKKTMSITVGKPRRERSVSFFRNWFPSIVSMQHSLGMGLEVETLNEQLGAYFGAPNEEGVLVKSVEKKSAGEKAGFKAGDVIVRIGKRTVDRIDDIAKELRKHKEGDKVEVEVLRKGQKKTLSVEVEDTDSGENVDLFRGYGIPAPPALPHLPSLPALPRVPSMPGHFRIHIDNNGLDAMQESLKRAQKELENKLPKIERELQEKAKQLRKLNTV